jgi:isoaspartyl peptidase/L-asparaginase-like protein (Ntn-hydrolase superfamily)
MKMEERAMEESTAGTMETDSASSTDSVAASGEGTFQTMEGVLGAMGRGTWKFVHGFPGHGAVPGFALGLGAAMLVGVGELAVGCFTAYVGYRIFAYGESLTEAVEKAIKFESGKLGQKEIDKPVPK